MKKALFAGLISAMLLFLAESRAYAWGSTWMGAALEQAVDSAHWRIGAFRYDAAFQLNNAGYDSDIYFGSLSERVPDYTFAAGPDVHVFLPLMKKIVFDILESPRYVFFLKTAQERALNNIFAGNVHVALDRIYLQAGADLTDAKQLWISELSMNMRLKEDNVSGLALWQASKGTSFALQYRWSKYDYENLASGFPNISESLNRTESFVNFITYLQQLSRARFYLNAEYGSYVFTDEASRDRNARSYGIYAGVEFLPPVGGYEDQTSGIRGSITLGYKRLDFLDPSLKDASGLAGNAGISLGIMKSTALRLFFSRGPQFSAYSGLTYYLQTAYGAGLSRSLSRHVLFTYDFSYSRSEYPAGSVTGGSPPESSAFWYATHAFRLSYQMRRDLEVSLLTNLGRRYAELAPRPVSNRTFIGLSLTYGYSAGSLVLPAGPMY
jgi:hypothetical protein